MKYCLPVFLLVCTFFLASNAAEVDMPCNHTPGMDRYKSVHIPLKEGYEPAEKARAKRSSDDPFTAKFTVSVTYDSTTNVGTSLLPAATVQQLKNTVVPKLTEFFESILMVRPVPGPLVFDRDCDGSFYISSHDPPYCVSTCEATTTCGTATIPANHLKICRQCNNNLMNSFANDCEETGTAGSGVDATFSLYITAVTTGSCSGSTLAFAGSCEMEDEYDRPIAGYINYCPNAFDGTESDDYVLRVSKHELLHALGFSNGLYQYWRNETGGLRSPSGTSTNVLKTVTYTDWSTVNGDVSHTVSLLITPNIVEEGKRHFNCSTLEGVQLEDQGGSGTAGSHWEARITRGEIMNGVISTGAIFSRFTYALLEDSGWYKVNYSYAEQLVWARGAGCELAAGSCGGYIQSQQAKSESIAPFCDYPQSPATQYGCNIQRTGVSNCNLATFVNALPTQYQYFSSALQGGSFQTADFCPYQSAFSNTICADTANTETGLDNSLAETYGPESRCVVHGSSWRAEGGGFFRQQTFPRAGCYNYTCSNGQVIIHILDQSYTCTTGGQQLSVSQTSDGITYTGSIICPSCLEICYDDFDNCPEAAQVYSEFVTTAATEPIIAITTATTTTSTTSTSSSMMMNDATSSTTMVESTAMSTTTPLAATTSSSMMNDATSSTTIMVSTTSTATTSSSSVDSIPSTTMVALTTTSTSTSTTTSSSAVDNNAISSSTLMVQVSTTTSPATTSSSVDSIQSTTEPVSTTTSISVVNNAISSTTLIEPVLTTTSATSPVTTTSSSDNKVESSSTVSLIVVASSSTSRTTSVMETVPLTTSTQSISANSRQETLSSLLSTRNIHTTSSPPSSTLMPTPDDDDDSSGSGDDGTMITDSTTELPTGTKDDEDDGLGDRGSGSATNAVASLIAIVLALILSSTIYI